jgi:phage baseplate assembly protein W
MKRKAVSHGLMSWEAKVMLNKIQPTVRGPKLEALTLKLDQIPLGEMLLRMLSIF